MLCGTEEGASTPGSSFHIHAGNSVNKKMNKQQADLVLWSCKIQSTNFYEFMRHIMFGGKMQLFNVFISL